MADSFIVVTSKNFRSWAIEYLWKGAAEAISLKTSEIPLGSFFSAYVVNRYASQINTKLNNKCLIVHHQTLFRLSKMGLSKVLQNSRLLLTHFEEGSIDPIRRIAEAHNITILTMSQADADRILRVTGKSLRIIPSYAGIDREIFVPSKAAPKKHFVLVTGNCKARKNPQIIFEVIRQLKGHQFVVEGQGWESFDSTGTLKSQNVRRLELNLQERAKIFREASVLLSLSSLEGGPLTILEALASGTPVVSSNAGFANEVIADCAGTIISDTRDVQRILNAIELRIETKMTVFQKDLLFGRFSLESYANLIYGIEDNA